MGLMIKVFVIIFLFAGFMNGCSNSHPVATQALPREVSVSTAEPAESASYIVTSGSFSYKDTTVLSFETGGTIQQLGFDENQFVAANEVLGLLDTKDLHKQAELARTQLEQAKVQLQIAQIGATEEQLILVASQHREAQLLYEDLLDQHGRYYKLFSEGAISERQLKDMERELAKVEQKVIQAEAALNMTKKGATPEEITLLQLAVTQAQHQFDLASNQLAKSRLISPVSGIVLKKLVNEGELVGQGHPVLVLADHDSLRFTFGATAAQLHYLSLGQTVQITLAENTASIPSKVEGTVTSIGYLPDPATRLYQIDVQIAADSNSYLRAGMVGQVSFHIPSPDEAFLVPVEAVVSKSNMQYVYLVGENLTVVAQEVTVGQVIGGRLEILAGLSGSEQIVVEGAPFLQDGEEVRIKAGGQK